MTAPLLLHRFLQRSAERTGPAAPGVSAVPSLDNMRLELLDLGGQIDAASVVWLLDRFGPPTPPRGAAR